MNEPMESLCTLKVGFRYWQSDSIRSKLFPWPENVYNTISTNLRDTTHFTSIMMLGTLKRRTAIALILLLKCFSKQLISNEMFEVSFCFRVLFFFAFSLYFHRSHNHGSWFSFCFFFFLLCKSGGAEPHPPPQPHPLRGPCQVKNTSHKCNSPCKKLSSPTSCTSWQKDYPLVLS